ncbi:clotting factor G beta subunit-like isoform X1 [Palaemon carinicauda]|uniref:clotting factor G beta subunit-like isoform X1 n=1 Tax=Palaemon carinicauda TaxID=392227 RepID=UPI0035B62542
MRHFVILAVVITLSTARIKGRKCNGKNCNETPVVNDILSNCVTTPLPWLCWIGHPCCRHKDQNRISIRGNAKRKCEATSTRCERRGGSCLGARDNSCLTADVPKLCDGDSCTCCVEDHIRCSSSPKCRFQGGYCYRGSANVYCPSQKIMREGCSGKKCSCCFTDRKCSCGKAIDSTRIVGGQRVKPKNKYPWMVGIQVPKLLKDVYVCGGAIINDLYVVTAAHCLINFDGTKRQPNDLLVGLADHRQNSTQDDVEGVTAHVRVQEVIIHEKYGPRYNNDIGLLKLRKPLDLSSYKQLKPVCLPTNPSNTYEGAIGVIYGWGIMNKNDDLSKVLRETTVPILDPGCNGVVFENTEITPMMLCAGYPEGDKDTCGGDSGGPLTVQENERHILVGVTSFGRGCGKKNSPGVYTRVTSLLDWILNNTKDATYCN